MTAFNTKKLAKLLQTYDERVEKLQELILSLEALGWSTFKRRELIVARALVQRHLSAIEAQEFGRKNERALVRQIDDTQEISPFDIERALEHVHGSALTIFRDVEQAYEKLHTYIFSQPVSDEEELDED